jgi:thiamine-monophosphate kinase
MPSGEFPFIHWLRERSLPADGVLVGPGDDCAVLAPPQRSQLVTTDIITEGVDFRLAEVNPRQIGRKAMAVNISDLAAMAGQPRHAVVGLVVPRQWEGTTEGRSLVQELYLGLQDVAHAFGVNIVGGDTNSWDGGLVVSVTLLGEATERGPVLRSGAKLGDAIFVTGPLGGSILGRHLTPVPRVPEALRLHQAVNLHAMIDISDGLAADLNHILEESHCGAVLIADAIPIHADAVELAKRTLRPALDHAMNDGEDFELVFTVSREEAELLERHPPVPNLALTRIGEIVEAGLWLRKLDVEEPLHPRGWEHGVV